MTSKPVEDIYPLAPLQKSFFFHSRLDPESTAYLVQLFWKLSGPLDVEAFRRAWEEVFRRHAVLRTDFAWKNLDEPLQVVYRESRIDFARSDGARDDGEGIERLLLSDRARPFDLGRAPLARLRLERVSDELHLFLWSFHHILLDGWSLGILLREVFALYRSFRSREESALPPPPPYRDYIAWLLSERRRAAGEPFFRRLLAGFRDPNRISWSRGPGRGPRETHLVLPRDLGEKLQALVRRSRLTLNTLIQGLWALVVSRESGDEDVVFGATVSGRPSEVRGVENMVGLFINTLPVRARIRRGAPLLSFLAELQEQALESRRYEHTAPLEIQGASEVARGLPLYESLLVFENYPLDPDLKRPAPDLAIEDVRYWSHTEIPLHLRVRPGDPLRLDLTHDRRAVTDERADSILAYLSRALALVVARPDCVSSDLLLLDADEVAEKKMAPLPRRPGFVRFEIEEGASSIPRRFGEIAAKHGERIAIEGGRGSLSFRELDQASSRLAVKLGEGASAGARVGLLLEHDASMVAALLAALKAGMAYVPLDPHFPRRRLADVLDDAQPELLVTSSRHRDLARELTRDSLPLLDLDEWGGEEERASPGASVPSEALAYLLYTSGSTGRPKGVMQSHENLLHHVRAYTHSLGIDRSDRLSLLSSFGFDAAVLDVFGALLNGATLCPFDVRERGVAPLGRFLQEGRITIYHSTPTVFRAFAGALPGDARFPDVRLVVLGGEEVTPFDARLFSRHFSEDAMLMNLFGATEATLALLHPVPRAGTCVPLGFPVEGVRTWLLDPEGRRAARVGEIGIEGRHLALGYWNRPEETRDRFLDGFENRERIYRTGDLGRLRADGTLELVGRKDFLVKIRGQRVETGEVEAVLAESGRVAKALVTAREIEGETALVAYVVPGSPPPAESELRGFLAERLPHPMIPSRFLFLPDLPMTPTGKVDRTALPPVPSGATMETESLSEPPRTRTEELVARVWDRVLRLGGKRIPLQTSFFDVGGHSLGVTQVASRLAEALGAEVPLRDLFEHPTIETLARRLESRFPELVGRPAEGQMEIGENGGHGGRPILETP